MRYDWTEHKDKEDKGKKVELKKEGSDNALDSHTQLVLSNSLYVSQTSVSSLHGYGLVCFAWPLLCSVSSRYGS